MKNQRSTGDTDRLLAAIGRDRLWLAHMQMAELGATPRGGVRRIALTAVDHAARVRMVEWAAARDHRAFTDAIGNLFVRREGTERDAAPVLTGSHLDSQPTGGKFDGPFGVLAGLEILQALDDAGIATRRPIEVVSWSNEEGCRFGPGCMGASSFATPSLLASWLACVDSDGISVETELRQLETVLQGVPRRSLGSPVHAYVEAHIEQGPVLEAANATIGIVSGVQGCRDFRVTVRGSAGHAGTTPAGVRRDALRAAVGLSEQLYRLADASGPDIRFTIGEMNVQPNSSSVIPSQVRFLIDFRHPSQEILRTVGDRVADICHNHQTPCEVSVEETRWREPVVFESKIQDAVRDAAERQRYASLGLVSGASHDAVHLHRVCPTGMIFIPCAGGLSHNEEESATPDDLYAGTRVLSEVLLGLSNS
ncbi:MAG: Zn-dependent hydrolase [Comamonadaceae bacterium]|nr:MAG: Zn-dependent hydrolase [Comamonadaceae bacterium]